MSESTALLSSSLAVTALAAICVAVIVSFTSLPPVIVVFAISASTITPELIAVTAVRPPARFGELTLKKNKVIKFKEKPQVSDGWINGGFFIANKNFLKFIKNKRTILEKDPLEKASRKGELVAFKHKGFWKCMDTLRDKNVLEKIYRKNGFK